MYWKQHAPQPLGSTGRGKGRREPATVTLKLEVAWNHIRFHQVRCGKELGEGELPSTTDDRQIWDSNLFGVTRLIHCYSRMMD